MTHPRLLGGRYQVGDMLGYGGMAEVHRGRDLRLGRDVAIKLLRTDLARDDTFQLRFRREAQNAAALNHPAIVAVYDTGEERGASGETLPYIVMEFVSGRTLKEVLQAEGRLQPRRALEITAEICAALDFSHRHSIIHRDIKPGNVMLTQTGQVKVMDFGIARALASGASTMTQTSAVIGTAQYLSPEQARGESVDARSDVYAAGCVLYELMTGQPPFIGDSPVAVAYQHVREEPKPPSYINRDVSPQVDSVVLKALAKNPMNRYQTAGDMRADALRAASGRPVHAEPVLRDMHVNTGVMARQLPPQPGRPMPTRVGEPSKPKNSMLAVAGLTGLAVLAVVALVAGLIAAQQPAKVTVPELAGMTKTAADTKLRGLKLVPDGKKITGVDCPVNTVKSQDPGVGVKVEESSTVHYEYCIGPGDRQVPVLAGLTQSVAQNQLGAVNLTMTVVTIDSEKPVGTVVGSDPAAGETVAEGSAVKVQISNGKLKLVPDLVTPGYTKDNAIGVLIAGGWQYDVSYRDELDPTKDGKVVGQNPPAGVAKDPTTTKITIFVAKYNGLPTGTPTVVPTT